MRAARSLPVARPGSIESIIAARRDGQVPSKTDLQQRTTALIASHCPARQTTPMNITASETALSEGATGSTMTVASLQARIEEIMAEPSSEDPWASEAVDVSDGADARSIRGTLLDGDFDEEESAASFAEALADYRKGSGDDFRSE